MKLDVPDDYVPLLIIVLEHHYAYTKAVLREDTRYRTENFCYGPLSCPLYRSGPTRKVPGRNGMVHEEPDWLDRDLTAHRGPDD